MTGLLIPLYADPDRDRAVFARVIAAHGRHPHVPMTIILNPDSGPGLAPLRSYAATIAEMNAAGIRVIGYVYTGYGKRDRAAVFRDIDFWRARYAVSGIFLDEMAYTAGHEDYYRSIAAHTRRAGSAYIVGNPGVDTLPAYMETVDAVVVHEAPGLPDQAKLGGWHALYGRERFVFLSYGIARLQRAQLLRLLPFVGQLYVLDEPGRPSFCCIPAYFDELLNLLDERITPARRPPPGQ